MPKRAKPKCLFSPQLFGFFILALDRLREGSEVIQLRIWREGLQIEQFSAGHPSQCMAVMSFPRSVLHPFSRLPRDESVHCAVMTYDLKKVLDEQRINGKGVMGIAICDEGVRCVTYSNGRKLTGLRFDKTVPQVQDDFPFVRIEDKMDTYREWTHVQILLSEFSSQVRELLVGRSTTKMSIGATSYEMRSDFDIGHCSFRMDNVPADGGESINLIRPPESTFTNEYITKYLKMITMFHDMVHSVQVYTQQESVLVTECQINTPGGGQCPYYVCIKPKIHLLNES